MSKPSNRPFSETDHGSDEAPVSPMPWAMDQSLDTRLGLDASQGQAPAKSRVSQGVLLLLLVLAVAAGALFVMRKTGAATVDTTANTAERKIEIALAQLTGKAKAGSESSLLSQNTDEVIARFAEDPTARQVDIDHVRKNPFMLTVAVQPTNTAQPVMTVNLEDRAKQQQLQQLRSELDKLSLQSVMEGRTPLAVISNKVVRAGDAIGSFHVVAIETRAVTLTADGNTYQLTMQQPKLDAQP